jgi:hypothetical protein
MMMRRSVTSSDAGKRSHCQRQLTEEDLTGVSNRKLEESTEFHAVDYWNWEVGMVLTIVSRANCSSPFQSLEYLN